MTVPELADEADSEPVVLLEALVSAYRKAKVDLYYATDPRLEDLSKYESDLERNLGVLLDRINGEDETWVREPGIIGGYTFIPHNIPVARSEEKLGKLRFDSHIWSDPAKAWAAQVQGRAGGAKPKAEFRLMGRCGIDLHVLSTVWISTVGAKLEAKMSDRAMGSRVRRTPAGEVNKLAPGSFKSYLTPYRRWRDGGMEAMRTALGENKSVIALTADVSSFYHWLSPQFLLDSRFVGGVLGVHLSDSEQKINRLFVDSLCAWSEAVASECGWEGRGLPVGLPACAVVANLALVELDTLAMEEFKPLYYGRYVDDIILVLEDSENIDSQRALWDWLIARSRGLLEQNTMDPGGSEAIDGDQSMVSVRFKPPYLDASRVVFCNDKNKTFHLSGETGLALIDSIGRAISERASEWKSLPSIPGDSVKLAAELASVTQADGMQAESLRDTDEVSARRSQFAIKLRNFEAYERDLDPASWREQRTAFFDAVCRHILVLPKYFELATYVPRLIKLAAACGDSRALRRLFQALAQLYADVVQSCELTVKSFEPNGRVQGVVADAWRQQIATQAYEGLASGLSSAVQSDDLREVVQALQSIGSLDGSPASLAVSLKQLHSELFVRDLAHVPFRFLLLGPELVPRSELPISRLPESAFVGNLPLASEVVVGVRELVDALKIVRSKDLQWPDRSSEEVISGLAFATRPPSMLELYLTLRERGAGSHLLPPSEVVRKILLGLRGYSAQGELPDANPDSRTSDSQTIRIKAPKANGTRRIALAMIATEHSSWKAAAGGTSDLSRGRYEALAHVLNGIIRRPAGVQYILLPELALPSKWFISFAAKLQAQGVNLISGVEYLRTSKFVVHNQVWAALQVDSPGYPTHIVYRQDKQCPAPAEEANLHNLARLRLEPETVWTDPPIIQHGDFHFSLLVCSELTNIRYRASLRGHVDALFVPEWNQDLRTFEALVESAALDIHAYIIQSNDRAHGDSRLRSPRRDEWERDIVRVRGGVENYVVIGDIDLWALRSHQSVHREPGGVFKPTPDGFEVSKARMRPRLLDFKEDHDVE